MKRFPALEKTHKPDGEALVANLLRKGTPKRVHHMELFHDGEIAEALVERFGLARGLDPNDPFFGCAKHVAVRRFLGFDCVNAWMQTPGLQLKRMAVEDTAALSRGQREFQDEHTGPITNWEEFEKYPWPPITPKDTAEFEWYEKNLPDDMCVVSLTGHFAEHLSWLMGYETLCFALFEQRDLVKALYEKILERHIAEVKLMLQFKRVRIVWGSDDMGFKTGLLISPADMREFVLPGHKKLAKMAHDAGRLYILHSCGQLKDIIDDLTDDVKIDARHSFEDTIQDVRDAKKTYGKKIGLIGGIDVDFLCRSDEQAIRKRVRDTIKVCQPGGGWCLGTGNSVANYIPLDNYLTMVDEGWRHGG